jgi:hypothetical protein
VLRRRREIAERYLGPLDCPAAERTLAVVRQEAELWAAKRGASEQQLREQLTRRRTRCASCAAGARGRARPGAG